VAQLLRRRGSTQPLGLAITGLTMALILELCRAPGVHDFAPTRFVLARPAFSAGDTGEHRGQARGGELGRRGFSRR
jgi:hypothetical protein